MAEDVARTAETRDPEVTRNAELLPPGTVIRRYEIIGRVGEGGMGVVYSARDTALERKVALKMLRDPGHVRQRQRLVREAQALARLSHPNVLAIHDVGEFRDHVFIAMELVAGGQTLRNWLVARPRGWREILDVYRAAGEGLAAAHEANLVHRDFKPDNVLVDLNGRVRVADFGLATVGDDGDTLDDDAPDTALLHSSFNSSLTRTGTVFGTPAYMAPEQHRGERAVSARADQFSFAVALYESVAGRHPFGESEELRDGVRTVGRIDRGEVAAAKHRIPGWLARALRRALASNPDQRYPAMRELLDALRPRRPWKWIAAAAVVAVAIAAPVAILLARDPAPQPQVEGLPKELPVNEESWEVSSTAVVSWDGARLDTFAVEDRGSILHRWTPGDRWHPYDSLGSPNDAGVVFDPTVVAYKEGQVALFAVGADRAVWYREWFDERGRWTEWTSLGGSATSAPSATTLRAGHMAVFVRQADGSIAYRMQAARGAPWQPWVSLGGRFASGPAATAPNFRTREPGADSLEVFATGGGALHRAHWTEAGWTAWAREPVGGILSDPAAVAVSPREVHVLWRSYDLSLVHYRPGSPPVSLGGTLAAAPEVTAWRRGFAAFVLDRGRPRVKALQDQRWTRWIAY